MHDWLYWRVARSHLSRSFRSVALFATPHTVEGVWVDLPLALLDHASLCVLCRHPLDRLVALFAVHRYDCGISMPTDGEHSDRTSKADECWAVRLRVNVVLNFYPSFDEACTGLTEVSVVNSFDLPTRATEHPAATSRHLLRHWGFLSLPPALAGGDGQAPAALGAKPLRVQHPGHGVCRCNVPFVGGRTE